MTIPDNISKREFARNSWIQHLPTNVCYAFLYDNDNDIPEIEKFDGMALNSTNRGIDGKRGEKLFNFYSYINKTKILSDVKHIVKMDDDVVLCPETLFEYLRQKIVTPDVYSGWFHQIDELHVTSSPTEVFYEARILNERVRADAMFVLLGRNLMNYIVSKVYCNQRKKEICDRFSQLYDNNMEGQSLGKWLSALSKKKIQIIPLNDIAIHGKTAQDLEFGYKSMITDENSKDPILIYHLGRRYNENTSLFAKTFNKCPLTSSQY